MVDNEEELSPAQRDELDRQKKVLSNMGKMLRRYTESESTVRLFSLLTICLRLLLACCYMFRFRNFLSRRRRMPLDKPFLNVCVLYSYCRKSAGRWRRASGEGASRRRWPRRSNSRSAATVRQRSPFSSCFPDFRPSVLSHNATSITPQTTNICGLLPVGSLSRIMGLGRSKTAGPRLVNMRRIEELARPRSVAFQPKTQVLVHLHTCICMAHREHSARPLVPCANCLFLCIYKYEYVNGLLMVFQQSTKN